MVTALAIDIAELISCGVQHSPPLALAEFALAVGLETVPVLTAARVFSCFDIVEEFAFEGECVHRFVRTMLGGKHPHFPGLLPLAMTETTLLVIAYIVRFPAKVMPVLVQYGEWSRANRIPKPPSRYITPWTSADSNR
jgi:hypothetical protein